ncbi:AI-2E family transporter [Paenibacillus antibioticophila]|uniref:AI-2E family transporter n=1 Tax=Paenibacillus antibioticophila TaxID=1274374 RepID=UPI001F1CF3E2|nr:AI-2E family transporter [Paenibacillus antibioticophila]
MIKNKSILFSLFVALLLLIIYLGSKVSFIFQPFLLLFQAVAIPLLLSMFLYYLLRPVVKYMEQHKIRRTPAILIIYVVFTIILLWFILSQWPKLTDQMVSLVNGFPDILADVKFQLSQLENNEWVASVFPSDNNIVATITEFLNKGFSSITNYVGKFFSFVSNFAIILFTTPILLFYMLKEGEKLGRKAVRATPVRFKRDMLSIITDIDKMLSGFIVGRVLVNLALGVLMYIGFLIIGLPYAFLLTVVAVIANFIPVIGAILSSVPIIIVGLTQSPATAVWALIIILAAQQVQDNLIAPYVFGKSMDIHPLTTIILVLGAGNISGIVGMIIIIPVYMILKIIVVRVFQIFFKRKWQRL